MEKEIGHHVGRKQAMTTKICETCKQPYEVDKHKPRQKHCTACANGRRKGNLKRGSKWEETHD